eukprot:293540-Rhodomonas_salina.1
MTNGVYEWSKAQCRPCGAGRYIMHEENECQDCPAGAVCECTEDGANEGLHPATIGPKLEVEVGDPIAGKSLALCCCMPMALLSLGPLLPFRLHLEPHTCLLLSLRFLT